MSRVSRRTAEYVEYSIPMDCPCCEVGVVTGTVRVWTETPHPVYECTCLEYGGQHAVTSAMAILLRREALTEAFREHTQTHRPVALRLNRYRATPAYYYCEN